MSIPSNLLSLDYVSDGLPFVQVHSRPVDDLYTLDFVDNGVPFVGNEEQLGTAPLVAALSITAPAATIKGWYRTLPNPRSEMVYSQQEPSHVFPYIAPQDPAAFP